MRIQFNSDHIKEAFDLEVVDTKCEGVKNLKIVLLDAVVENQKLEMNKQYEVVRTETVRDDLYYVVVNIDGKEIGIHELVAKEITV